MPPDDDAADAASDDSLSIPSLNEKYKQLSIFEKSQLADEFVQLNLDYQRNFFVFARNLPEQRVVDYLEYERQTIKQPKSRTKPKVLSFDSKLYKPFEVFCDESKASEGESAFIQRNKLKVLYAKLDDSEKLKYIKKAESNYDSSEVSLEKIYFAFKSNLIYFYSV